MTERNPVVDDNEVPVKVLMRPVKSSLTADAFHLPGNHNQKSHGNRAGKKDNVPGKTSKHAPLSPKSDGDAKKSSPKSKTARIMSKTEFDDRSENAAQQDDVFAETPVDDELASVINLISTGDLKGVDENEVRAAYADYTGAGYLTINDVLRATNDLEYLGKSTRKTVEVMDKVMDASKIRKDIFVYRGIRNPQKTFGKAFVNSDEPDANRGLTWVDNAFVSTSTKQSVSSAFSGSGSVLMRILVPKGAKATGTPYSQFPQESEVVLDRGTKFRVVSSQRSGPTGTMIFDVEVVLP